MILTTEILRVLNTLKNEGALEAVVYNSPTKVNVELDTTAHPVAVLYLFRDGAIDMATGLVHELADVNVMFLTHQDELDFRGASNEALLDSMAAVATDFLAGIVEGGVASFESDEITMRGVYDFNDKNTTGVSLQFRLREIQGRCL